MSFRNTIRMSNSLDPDQAWSDLVSNCLQRLSADDNRRQRVIIFGAIGNKTILAMTCYFQQCGILTSVDSDESVQPPLKLRISKCCSVSS